MAPERSDASRPVVLVVDDEPDILATCQQVLEGMLDLTVVAAASGPAALEILRHRHVDAIVSDYRMPDMDGLTFLAQARELAPGAPRILFTAYIDPRLEQRALEELGPSRFLAKGIDAMDLVKKLKVALTQAGVI